MGLNLQSGAFLRLDHDQVLVFNELKRTDDVRNSQIVIRQFFGTQMTHFCAGSQQILTVGELKSQLAAKSDVAAFRKSDFALSRNDFRIAFEHIGQLIESETISKGVAAIPSQLAALTEMDRAKVISFLLEAPLTLNVYGFWHQEQGMVGATPELLFVRNKTQVQTMALAGTSRSQSEKDFLNDEKMRREHQYVIDDMKMALSRCGDLKIGETRVVTLPHLSHLLTSINVSDCHLSDVDLIDRLHPTPALGVFPRSAGYEWMANLPQQEQRGYYGAPILFRINSSESRCLVMIRSLFWSRHLTQIWVGCGLVKGSQFEEEFQELNLKLKSVLRLCGLFDE